MTTHPLLIFKFIKNLYHHKSTKTNYHFINILNITRRTISNKISTPAAQYSHIHSLLMHNNVSVVNYSLLLMPISPYYVS